MLAHRPEPEGRLLSLLLSRTFSSPSPDLTVYLQRTLLASKKMNLLLLLALAATPLQSWAFQYPSSCTELYDQGSTTDGLYTIYPDVDNPTTTFSAYCDQTTDGGGWMLTTAYKHTANTNPALVPATIPTGPSTGFSHVDLDAIYPPPLAENLVSEVRLYCTTTENTRVMHFKTSNAFQKGVAWDGDRSGAVLTDWTTGITLLSGHTANLPLATTSADAGWFRWHPLLHIRHLPLVCPRRRCAVGVR